MRGTVQSDSLGQPLERRDGQRDGSNASWRGDGCADCNATGYRGRMGIFEIFVVNEEKGKLLR
jgi:type II secretory ATPase GspE/PulE/Tfp pilus assembly ATPase PilB-like protein